MRLLQHTCKLLLPVVILLAAIDAQAASPMGDYLKSTPRLEGFSLSEVANTIEPNDCDNIEGVWQINADGNDGLFAIVRDKYTSYYRMVVVDSADRRVASGTVMGAIIPLAADGYYDARIYRSVKPDGLASPKRYTLQLHEDGRLIFKPVTDKYTIDFWRLIPYMYRIRVRHINDRDKNLDGALRIWPEPIKPHDGPRTL